MSEWLHLFEAQAAREPRPQLEMMDITFSPNPPRTWNELLELRDYLTVCDVSFLRKTQDHRKYQSDMNSVSREEGVRLITEQFEGKDVAIIPNKYPHTNLLKYLPDVTHYCLWSLRGELTDREIELEVMRKFSNKKWTWMTRKAGYVSIPEIWHSHIYVASK